MTAHCHSYPQTKSSTYSKDGRGLVIQYGTGDMRGVLDNGVYCILCRNAPVVTYSTAAL